MFSNLNKINYFDNLVIHANNDIIKKDRMNYMPIINMVKEHIKKINNEKIIISDVKSLIYNFYNNNKKSKQFDIYNNNNNILNPTLVLYSTKPKTVGTSLANAIHSNFGKFTQMKSIITDYEYVILYDMRPLITIYKVEEYKNKDIVSIINPTLINNNYFLPINIELLDIYHNLFLLNNYNNWNELIIQEQLLFPYFIAQYKIRINTLKKTISGGSCISCKINRNTNINNVKYVILELFNNENYIFINNWALYLISQNKKLDNSDKNNDDNIISIISQNSIESDYSKISNFLSKFTKYGIFYKENKLYIPNNRRLKLYTFYIKYPDIISKNKISTIDKPFLEIYNNGNYELLPYIPITYKYNNNVVHLKIGNYFVLLYFIFIRIWVLYLLDGLNLIKKNKAYIIYTNYHNLIETVNKNKKIFNITKNYIGINYDEKIEKKITISKSNIIKKNYYPEVSIKKDKKYKLLATS